MNKNKRIYVYVGKEPFHKLVLVHGLLTELNMLRLNGEDVKNVKKRKKKGDK